VPWVCAINVEEVWRGIQPSEEADVARLLGGVRVIPLDRTEGEVAGRWRRTFAERGVTLHQADCLIAAAALRIGATLATGNPAHYPMSEIIVEHWPVGA
jgi:predicted nucleic acid-binding protein